MTTYLTHAGVTAAWDCTERQVAVILDADRRVVSAQCDQLHAEAAHYAAEAVARDNTLTGSGARYERACDMALNRLVLAYDACPRRGQLMDEEDALAMLAGTGRAHTCGAAIA